MQPPWVAASWSPWAAPSLSHPRPRDLSQVGCYVRENLRDATCLFSVLSSGTVNPKGNSRKESWKAPWFLQGTGGAEGNRQRPNQKHRRGREHTVRFHARDTQVQSERHSNSGCPWGAARAWEGLVRTCCGVQVSYILAF